MSIEDRVEKIEADIKEIETTITEVKVQVINHIPHMIQDVRTDVAELSKKIRPLKEKDLKSQGVHEFLNLALKGFGLLAAIIWTFLRISDKLNWFGM